MLSALHGIAVRPGDTVYVPAGLPHAIGAGILLLELQQAADLSLLLEYSGFAIDGLRDGHLGIGFDAALRCVRHDAVSTTELDQLGGRWDDSHIFPAAADEFFRAERIAGDVDTVLEPGFSVLAVVAGSPKPATWTCGPDRPSPCRSERGLCTSAASSNCFAPDPRADPLSGAIFLCRWRHTAPRRRKIRQYGPLITASSSRTLIAMASRPGPKYLRGSTTAGSALNASRTARVIAMLSAVPTLTFAIPAPTARRSSSSGTPEDPCSTSGTGTAARSAAMRSLSSVAEREVMACELPTATASASTPVDST